ELIEAGARAGVAGVPDHPIAPVEDEPETLQMRDVLHLDGPEPQRARVLPRAIHFDIANVAEGVYGVVDVHHTAKAHHLRQEAVNPWEGDDVHRAVAAVV